MTIFAPLNIINEIASDIYHSSKSLANFTKDRLISELEIGLQSYLNITYDRLSAIKTLLSPVDALKINDIFVNPRLNDGKNEFDFDDLISHVISNNRTVISAIAGHGKSVLLKKLFCDFSTVNYGFIPFFLELRDVEFEGQSLVETVYEAVYQANDSYPLTAFRSLLKSGRVILFLDGLDEIGPKSRMKALKQVDKFSKDFPRMRVVITTRPIEEMRSWVQSKHYTISNFDIGQVKKLVSKSPISDVIKERFIKKLEEEYITTHESFLANPLLCNMMILTFMRGGDIPSQRHIFYKKAFETLFRHHDDMKFLYRREFHSDLQEDVFVRLWRAFCFFGYKNHRVSFDREQLLSHVKDAVDYIGIEADHKKVADDFVESLCIIIKDGDKYEFLHRSFQEYGAATFICFEQINDPFEILSRLNTRYADDIIPLAFMTNQELIEQKYLLPSIENLISLMSNARTVKKKILVYYTAAGMRADETGEPRFYMTLSQSHDRKTASPNNIIQLIRKIYGIDLGWDDVDRLQSWVEEKGESLGGEIELSFENTSAVELNKSPLKEFVKDISDGMNRIRKEILDRRSHQERILAFR